jgi:phage repressor protein C with HTH and peptisase S24 domain
MLRITERQADMTDTRGRVLEALEKSGVTRREASLKLGQNPAYLSDYLNKKSPKSLPLEVATKLAEILGVPPHTFFPSNISNAITEAGFSFDISKSGEYKVDDSSAVFDVPEIDAQAGAGGGGFDVEEAPNSKWRLPLSFIRYELNTEPENLRLIRARGDSMEPSIRTGSRLIVDIKSKKPSPPGVFCLHDGIGLIVKHVELIPNSDRVHISSSNPAYRSYEMTADEVHIIGRVVASTQPG